MADQVCMCVVCDAGSVPGCGYKGTDVVQCQERGGL